MLFIEFLKSKYHLKDDWPIVCEPYIQWVIEDNFSNGNPPLEKLGVQFVPDVTPYEKMKIRLLNAGHSVSESVVISTYVSVKLQIRT